MGESFKPRALMRNIPRQSEKKFLDIPEMEAKMRETGKIRDRQQLDKAKGALLPSGSLLGHDQAGVAKAVPIDRVEVSTTGETFETPYGAAQTQVAGLSHEAVLDTIREEQFSQQPTVVDLGQQFEKARQSSGVNPTKLRQFKPDDVPPPVGEASPASAIELSTSASIPRPTRDEGVAIEEPTPTSPESSAEAARRAYADADTAVMTVDDLVQMKKTEIPRGDKVKASLFLADLQGYTEKVAPLLITKEKITSERQEIVILMGDIKKYIASLAQTPERQTFFNAILYRFEATLNAINVVEKIRQIELSKNSEIIARLEQLAMQNSSAHSSLSVEKTTDANYAPPDTTLLVRVTVGNNERVGCYIAQSTQAGTAVKIVYFINAPKVK